MEIIIYLTALVISITGSYATYNYHASLDYIKGINSQNITWKAGINFPDGLTLEQMKNFAGSEPPRRQRTGLKIRKTAVNDFPENFDLRQKHPYCPSIGTVYNQGNCRSSWAIAPASTLTDHVCIKTKGSQTTPFSAHHVISCCRLCGHGCKGGWDDAAFFFFRRHGAITGGDYNSKTGCQPYGISPCTASTTANDTTGCKAHGLEQTPKCYVKCTNPNYKMPFNKDKYKIKDLGGCESVYDAKTVLHQNGPLEVTMKIYTDIFHYKSGIYRKTEGAKFIGFHCAKIIGYGKENDDYYWKVVNSWGTQWGMDGTAKIAEKVNGIELIVEKMQYPNLFKNE